LKKFKLKKSLSQFFAVFLISSFLTLPIGVYAASYPGIVLSVRLGLYLTYNSQATLIKDGSSGTGSINVKCVAADPGESLVRNPGWMAAGASLYQQIGGSNYLVKGVSLTYNNVSTASWTVQANGSIGSGTYMAIGDTYSGGGSYYERQSPYTSYITF